VIDIRRFCRRAKYDALSRSVCAADVLPKAHRQVQADVGYLDEDDREIVDSPLWPKAADGSSGLREKRLDMSPAPTTPSGSFSASRSGESTYRVRNALGTTAYGRAFEAQHIAQDRDVAVHYFTLDDDSEGTLARALPLAVAKCAQLSHPNVIAVQEHGRDERNGSYYLVTEPLEGVSLTDFLANEGQLSLTRALSITLQVGRALRAAHKLGIAHGALSPDNVRVIPSEQGDLVRVLGFGCTSFAPRPVASGDPYRAPEAQRDSPADARSDIYALGALVYRMLTGRSPAPVKGGVAEPPSITAYSEEPIPRDLEELVARCMDRNPEARLADIVPVMQQLRVIARSVNLSSFPEERASVRPTSLPPDAVSESDSSGSLWAEAQGYRGAMWILAGLLLALAAVWLVWEASTRSTSPTQHDVSH